MKSLLKKASILTTTVGMTAANVQVVLANDPLGSIEPQKGYAANIGSVISSALSIAMVFAALLVLLYLVWGGIEWITSGGDKGKTESARNKITAAIIGLIILAAAFALFNFAIYLLGFDNTTQLLESIQRVNTGS